MLTAQAAVTVAVLALVTSSVVCLRPVSPPGRPVPSEARFSMSSLLSSVGGRGLVENTSSAKAILLILRQKCQEWRRRGLVNLPSYCYVFGSSSSVLLA